MTDPFEALTSFQQAFLEGELELQRGQIDKSILVHVDHPNGSPRFTYVRIEGGTVIDLDSVDEYHASLPRLETRAS